MSNIEEKLVAGALGALTTIIAQKAIRVGWTTITGSEPPKSDDLDTSTGVVVAWVAASAIGVTVAQVLVSRMTKKGFAKMAARRCQNT